MIKNDPSKRNKIASPNHKLLKWSMLACALILLCGYVVIPLGISAFVASVARTQIAGNQPTLPIDPLDDPPLPVVAPAGRHHKALTMVMDFSGVTKPIFQTVETAVIDQFAPVVGIVVDGKAYAFPTYMLSDPTNHVVNLVLNEKPITVTYCNMVDCARVLTQNDGLGLIQLRNGGLDVADQMVLKLEDDRYGQSSDALPLDDYPFEAVPYHDWLARHPATLVYDGPEKEPARKPSAAIAVDGPTTK